jgi:hypothetical protein
MMKAFLPLIEAQKFWKRAEIQNLNHEMTQPLFLENSVAVCISPSSTSVFGRNSLLPLFNFMTIFERVFSAQKFFLEMQLERVWAYMLKDSIDELNIRFELSDTPDLSVEIKVVIRNYVSIAEIGNVPTQFIFYIKVLQNSMPNPPKKMLVKALGFEVFKDGQIYGADSRAIGCFLSDNLQIFTPMHWDVLQVLSEDGKFKNDVAKALKIKVDTVRDHEKAIRRRWFNFTNGHQFDTTKELAQYLKSYHIL